MAFTVGIDEAGRGPVIGSMVMAAVKVEDDESISLSDLDVDDSKVLSSERRESLFSEIKGAVDDYCILVVPPEVIDDALHSEGMDLNKLEAHTSADLLNSLGGDEAIVDCPSRDIEGYKRYLEGLLDFDIDLRLEHDAERFPEVAAASILAKVVRDRSIEDIKEDVGIDFGSGYMGDGKTRDFLEEYYDVYPEIFRRSWESYKEVVRENEQSSLDSF